MSTRFQTAIAYNPLHGQPGDAHPANADRILAFSLFGEVYGSEDAGESWRKIERESGEIRAIAWLPN